ncbi:hypothetical protein C8R45DRAFT_1077251 [Mycena sanguinolenta]|nr:hypothetical protein C8R45DRAFT_1077251 [Mycena sanguinolenta]
MSRLVLGATMESDSPVPASLAPLLRSNDAPTPSQKSLVEGILRGKQTELSVLGDEISRLENSLCALRMQQADLAAEMHEYSCILSPIRHVPPEIIGEIFLYFAPSTMHPDGFRPRPGPGYDYYNTWAQHDSYRVVRLPWKLGHICHQWRIISRSLSQLCTVLDLGPQWCFRKPDFPVHRRWVDDEEGFTSLLPALPTRDDGTYGYDFRTCHEDSGSFEIATSLDYIEEYLQRCGRRPFCLRLWPGDFATPILFEALLKHMGLCNGIVLLNISPGLFDRFFQVVGDLQELRKIAFVCTLPDLTNIFRYPPNVTDLTLVQVGLPAGSHAQIPWSQLTRYCEIDCWWNPDDEGRLMSYRKLTNLRILHLRLSHLLETDTPLLDFHGHYCQTNTIQLFHMPVLENCILELENTRHFEALLPHSSPRLKSFRVRVHPTSPWDAFWELSDLGRALEMFPDLKELSLDVPNLISDADISALIPNSSHLPVAFKLEILRLSNRSFKNKNCRWQTLVDMLQARFQPPIQGIPRLRTFEFCTDYSSYDVNVTADLKALAKRNQWDIRVSHFGPECLFPPWENHDELRLG